MEIERKFTIKELPADLENYPHRLIEQAYLCTSPVVRVRRDNDHYYMTYKGSGLMSREEYNLPLDEVSYEHLKQKADGYIITKTRYEIPIKAPRFMEGYVPTKASKDWEALIELDIFTGDISLIMAEVEFPDEETANAYLPEDWFLEDVTGDKRYHNSNMSRNGFKAQ